MPPQAHLAARATERCAWRVQADGVARHKAADVRHQAGRLGRRERRFGAAWRCLHAKCDGHAREPLACRHCAHQRRGRRRRGGAHAADCCGAGAEARRHGAAVAELRPARAECGGQVGCSAGGVEPCCTGAADSESAAIHRCVLWHGRNMSAVVSDVTCQQQALDCCSAHTTPTAHLLAGVRAAAAAAALQRHCKAAQLRCHQLPSCIGHQRISAAGWQLAAAGLAGRKERDSQAG